MFLKFPLNLKEKGVSNLRGRERVRQCILPGGGRSFALQWKREKIRIRRSLNSRKWRDIWLRTLALTEKDFMGTETIPQTWLSHDHGHGQQPK